MPEELRIDARRVLPEASVTYKTARASGPGGQHVNRTESKVQLTFDPRAVPWIDEGTRLRIIALSGRHVDAGGRIQITSQEHREQPRNIDDARERLTELVRRALIRPKPRIATKPSKAAKRRRLDEKSIQSAKKQARGRVRGDD